MRQRFDTELSEDGQLCKITIVNAEFLAMDLGKRVGLRVAGVELTAALGRDVLLVERFDRVRGRQPGTCFPNG